MSESHFEELAALNAVGLLDEAGQTALRTAMDHDPELRQIVLDYAETAALLAYAAPAVKPPPELKRAILSQLPSRKVDFKIVAFSSWIPYAIAACLMALGIYQAWQIAALKSQLLAANTAVTRLNESNSLMGLQLAELEAKDVSYVSARVMVAWDPYLHHGVVSIQNLPSPPSGHDYQLWVLDPAASAPLSAGLIHSQTGAHTFASQPVKTTSPGFAISLEPSGGSMTPTGTILFAVAPGT